MTTDRNNDDNAVSNRRTFLAATAIGSTVLAGCLSSDDDGSNSDEDDTNDDDSDDPATELHERYGYPTTEDEEPPVEPDHEVDLMMDFPEKGSEQPPEFYFEPTGLAVESGDVVQFNFDTPDHAVATFHEAFGRSHRAPADAEPLSSPMMGVGTDWLVEFDEPGVWDLYCPPHEMFGMGMRIVVDEATGPATEPASEMEYVPGESRPPEEPLAATYDNEALEPETVLEAGSVSWDDLK